MAALIAAPLLAQDEPDAAVEPQGDLPQIEQQVEQTRAEAIAQFRRFIEDNPDYEHTTAARFRLASLLIEDADDTGAYGPAIEQLELVLAAVERGEAGGFEQHAETWYLLGWCLEDLGPTRATEAWQRVVQLEPGSELAASALLKLGSQAMDQADWEQATTHFEAARATNADPATIAQASYLAGWTYYKTNAWSQATEAFAAVLASEASSVPRDEALQYMVLVLVEHCDELGADIVGQLDYALASVPASLQASFVERTITVLEGMARFEEADALRRRADGPAKKRRKRTKGKERG